MNPQTARRSNGFAMVELIIGLLMIGALAALILNSLQIERAKSRDATRRNDIDTIAAQLETCYNNTCHGAYPTLLQLTDTLGGGFVQTDLPGLRADALYDSSAGPIQSQSASAATQYQYVITPQGCTGTGGEAPCMGYTLRAYQETNPNHPYTKQSAHK